MNRKIIKLVSSILIIILLMAVVSGCSEKNDKTDVETSTESKGTITLADGDFTEQYIVLELMKKALETNGYTVDVKEGVSSAPLVHEAMLNGEIDVKTYYTGVAWLYILKRDPIYDVDEVYNTLKKEFHEQFNLTWLKQSRVNNGYGIVVRKDVAEKLKLKTLTDFQKNAGEIVFANHDGWMDGNNGMPRMTELYGEFNFKEVKQFDGGLRYPALINKQADATTAYTTDAQLIDPQFVLLEEDKPVWPPYYLTPVVRQEVLDEHPEIEGILNELFMSIDPDEMIKMNAKADIDKGDYAEIANEYYETYIKK